MQPTQLIYDGYTRDGYIASHDGELSFRYRPMLRADFLVLSDEAKRLDARPAETLWAAAIAERLVSWNAVDGTDAKPAEIDTASVLRLAPPIRVRLLDIISGWAPSDPLPKAEKKESDAYVQRLLEASKKGQPVGQAELAADRKNSSKG
jgi:hypothetical protein